MKCDNESSQLPVSYSFQPKKWLLHPTFRGFGIPTDMIHKRKKHYRDGHVIINQQILLFLTAGAWCKMKVGIIRFCWIHWKAQKARGLTPIGLGQGEAPKDTKLGWPGDWTWDPMIKLLYSCNSMLTKSWTVRHWPSVFVFSWRFEKLLVLTHSWKGFPLQTLLREQHWLEKRAPQLHKAYHTEHTYLITSEHVS